MRVAHVKADGYVAHVVNEVEQLFRRREFVGDVLDQQRDTERLGERLDVLDGTHAGFELGFVVGKLSHN